MSNLSLEEMVNKNNFLYLIFLVCFFLPLLAWFIFTPGCSGGIDLSDFDLAKGEQIYNNTCIACHLVGMPGAAPKVGNKNEWAPRTAQGMGTLISHSLNGFNAMPKKGGDANLSDEQVKNAVAFMVSKSQ